MKISFLFPEINTWDQSFKRGFAIQPPRISKSKRRRLLKKAKRSQQVMEADEVAGLLKGVPPFTDRPSIEPPAPATDPVFIKGVEPLTVKEKALVVADSVLDFHMLEKRSAPATISDLVSRCPYVLRSRIKEGFLH